MVKSILFIPTGDKDHQSTMHRCYLHAEEFGENKILSKVIPIKRGKSNNSFYILFRYIQNLFTSVIHIPFYKVIIFHRRKDPFSLFLLFYSKIFRKKILYDFDDAIYMNQYFRMFDLMVKYSDSIICSNPYLASQVMHLNQNIEIISSPVDTENFFKRKVKNNNKFVIGWLGPGEDHYVYLKNLFDLLKINPNLKKYKLKLVSSLGSKKIFDLFSKLDDLEVDYGKKYWINFLEIPNEIKDFDVSVMPLISDKWSNGKQSMKLLESMAMEIPVIGSNIGYNKLIISNGWNGFLFDNQKQFNEKLEILYHNKKKRIAMGKNGRIFIHKNYSLKEINNKLSIFIDDILLNEK